MRLLPIESEDEFERELAQYAVGVPPGYALLVLPNEESMLYRAWPDNRRDFTLKELQEAVDGYVETVPVPLISPSVLLMIVNEDGLRLRLPFNPYASGVAGQPIVGTALLTPRRFVR